MNPKEKAAELIKKFKSSITQCGQTPLDILEDAKDCAIIAVDEMISVLPSVNGRPPNYQTVDKYCSEFWQEVKKELTI